jgi:chemotaxis protein methyltransferase CheR
MAVLSPQLFGILRGLVEDKLGMRYGPEDAEVFGDKIAARAREAAFESILDYYYFLRYDPGAAVELEALADALVVGETYFFRELEAARAGVEHVLVPAVRQRGRARIWSAACATGEEPLSIAMLLREAGIDDRTEIVATDLSGRAIASARAGSYGARSLRATPPAAPAAGWTRSLAAIAGTQLVRDGERARVSRALLAKVDYRQLNLLDGAAIAALGPFDLILCRNVLIYFADPIVLRVIASLSSALAEDGRLLIGAAESLLRFGTALRCEERSGAFFYKKGPS